jgi:hypothetical protein
MRLFATSPEAPPAASLEPIRIYTDDAVADGWVVTGGVRMTDILAREEEIAFLPDGADPGLPGAWVGLLTGQLRMVVPPPHVSPAELRQPRERQEVMLRVGDHRVAGVAHLRRGHERDVFLRATQPYLPLTEATVMRADGSEPQPYEVVIVSLRWAEFV